MPAAAEFAGNDPYVDFVLLGTEGNPHAAFGILLYQKYEVRFNRSYVIVDEFVTECVRIHSVPTKIFERHDGADPLSSSDFENGREGRSVNFRIAHRSALVQVANQLHIIGPARKKLCTTFESRRNRIGIAVASGIVEDAQKEEICDFGRDGGNASVVFEKLGDHVASGGVARIHPTNIAVTRTVVVDIENGRRIEQFPILHVQSPDHRNVAGVADDDEIVLFIGNLRLYAVAHPEEIVERAYGARIDGINVLPFRTSVRLEREQASEGVTVEIVGGRQ